MQNSKILKNITKFGLQIAVCLILKSYCVLFGAIQQSKGS